MRAPSKSNMFDKGTYGQGGMRTDKAPGPIREDEDQVDEDVGAREYVIPYRNIAEAQAPRRRTNVAARQ